MRRLAMSLVALGLGMTPALSRAQGPEILIFGGDGHTEFLGCLTCSETAGNSVWNEFSKYGWQNEFATWGEFGKYGSQFGAHSACNEYANDPPVLVDRSGAFYGTLTISEYKKGSVCGGATEGVCTALKVMCAHKS